MAKKAAKIPVYQPERAVGPLPMPTTCVLHEQALGYIKDFIRVLSPLSAREKGSGFRALEGHIAELMPEMLGNLENIRKREG
jgi:hypothetical protein